MTIHLFVLPYSLSTIYPDTSYLANTKIKTYVCLIRSKFGTGYRSESEKVGRLSLGNFSQLVILYSIFKSQIFGIVAPIAHTETDHIGELIDTNKI